MKMNGIYSSWTLNASGFLAMLENVFHQAFPNTFIRNINIRKYIENAFVKNENPLTLERN